MAAKPSRVDLDDDCYQTDDQPGHHDHNDRLDNNSVTWSGKTVSEPDDSYVEGTRKRRKPESFDADRPNLDSDEIRRLISPLARDQLVTLLTKACMKFTALQNDLMDIARSTPASRRLMIRNIAFNTTDEAFRAVFEVHGDIEDIAVVRDRTTGKSKGFGFVTFKNLEPVGKVLKGRLQLDGRELAVKLAAEQGGGGETAIAQTNILSTGGRCKLFVRGLCDETTDTKLHSEFSHFGTIQEAVVVRESSGRSKGYGFVTFLRPEDAAKAVLVSQKVIDGRVAFVALATPSQPKTSPVPAVISPGTQVVSPGVASYGMVDNMGGGYIMNNLMDHSKQAQPQHQQMVSYVNQQQPYQMQKQYIPAGNVTQMQPVLQYGQVPNSTSPGGQLHYSQPPQPPMHVQSGNVSHIPLGSQQSVPQPPYNSYASVSPAQHRS